MKYSPHHAASAPLRRGTILILAGTIATLLAQTSTRGATIAFDGGESGTDAALDAGTNWAGDVLPGTEDVVLFDDSVRTPPAQLTHTSADAFWGSLIWASASSSSITIDTSGGINRSIILSGGGGSAEAVAQGGAAGDLILMGTDAANSTLSIGGNAGTGAARLNLVLATSGNLNVVSSGATLDISSNILGTNVSLTKTGAGTLTLSGTNSFGGATSNFTLAAGTLNINSATALGVVANTFVLAGGTIDNTSGAAITTSAYKQTWDGDFTFKGTNDLAFGNGAITLGTAAGTSRTVTVTDGTLTFAGAISNGSTANSIIKAGAGTLVLNGAGSYTGGLTIKSGTVIGGAATAFGAAAGAITLGDTSGSADATVIAAGATIPNPVVVASGSSGNILTIRNASTAVSNTTFSGAITLGHDLVLEQASSTYLTVNAAITEQDGAWGITVNAGSGTVTLNAANTFTGGLTLNTGRLRVATGSTGTGVFTITGGSLDTGSGATLSNSAYHWYGDFIYRGLVGVTLNGGAVVINGDRILDMPAVVSTGAGLTVAGGISDGGNGYSFTKRGSTLLTLQGVSTYSGATVLQEGSLNLNAANSELRNTSSLTVTGGILTIGVGSGTAVADRINPNAPLTVGGNGTVTVAAVATGGNSQRFTSLNVLPGSAQIGTNSTTTPGRVTFTDAADSVYSRAVGGTVRFTVGASHSFTNAPSGASTIGTGSSAILIGAVSGAGSGSTTMTDFVQVGAGAITAPTYANDTWQTGTNTNVVSDLTVAGATQSLRFDRISKQKVTLTGLSTIESGGILVTSTAVGGGTITGGTLQADSGRDLWTYVSTPANYPQGLTIESQIGDHNGSSLTKSGPGTLFLRNENNSYAGGTYLNEGIINITSGGALGTGGLRFSGNGTLQTGADSVNLGDLSITIDRAQIATFDAVSPTQAFHHSGVISGDGGLTKIGRGSLSLSGANTYKGTTSVTNGTLILDFDAAGAPASNIIPSDSLLSVGTGAYYIYGASSQTIVINGKAGASSSQTFGGTYTSEYANDNTVGLYAGRGMSRLDLNAGEGGSLTVDVGRIARGYSTDQNVGLDIEIGPNVTVLTSAPNGLLGGFATVNGTTWATVVNGTIQGYTAYSTSYSSSGAALDVGNGGTLTVNPGYLRFNNNTAATVNSGAGVVRAITQGGVLVTPNVGANLSTITGAPIIGYSGRDLVIHQNNVEGDLLIDAPIVNASATSSGSRPISIAKHGFGTAILAGANTNTGPAYINEGTLIVTGDVVPAFTRTANSTAASPVLTMADTSGIFIGQEVTQSTGLGTNATWIVVAIDPNQFVTLSVAAGSTFNGTFNFSASGGLGVGTGGVPHQIGAAGTLQIGNGGTTGSIQAGQVLANQGKIVLNRSDDFTLSNAITGIGALEKRGAGTATLGVSTSFTGDTRIYDGVLKLGGVSTLASSTLDYSGYGGTLSFGTLTSAIAGGLKGSQELVLTNEDAAAVTLTVGGNGQDTILTGGLSGLGSMSKTGGGALTIGGVNTYAGSTSMSQGTLNFEGTFTDTSTLTVSGGVLNLSGTFTRTAYSTSGGLTVSGGVLNITGQLGTSALIPTAQTAFLGNSITNLYGTAYMSGASSTFRVGDPTPATFNVLGGSLTIGNNGAGLVIGRGGVNGRGTFNLVDGSVTIGGTATVVRIGAAYLDTETGAGPSVLNISGGLFTTGTTTAQFLLGSNLAGNTTGTGTLNLDGGTLATARVITGGKVGQSFLNLNGGTFRAMGSTASIAESLTFINVRNGGAVFDTNGFDINIPGALLHSTIDGDAAIDGGLTKRGGGALNLTGANTFTGNVRVEEGILGINAIAPSGTAQPLGVAGSAITLGSAGASATLQYTGNSDAVLGRDIALGAAGGGFSTTGAGELTVAGAVAASTGSLTLDGRINVTGAITGTLDGGLVVASGTAILSNAGNNYTGPTLVQSATLKNGVTNALPTTTILTFAESAATPLAVYDLGGYDQTLAGLAAAPGGNVESVFNTGNTNSVLRIESNTTNSEFGGEIRDGASASIALSKAGLSTLTLSGSNAYSGPTTIEGGMLIVSGSIEGTSGVTVQSGGTVQLTGGSERVNDLASVDLGGGRIGFGDALEGFTETAGTLKLTADSVIDFGSGHSNAFVFSSLSLDGHILNVYHWTGSLYDAVNPEPDHGGTQDRLLFTADMSMQDLASIRFYADGGSTFLGTGAQIGFGESGFQIVAVPEPGAGLLAIGALTLLGLGYRRRRG